MKVLGISGSPRKGKTTERLVREVLNAVEGETEFISLRGKRISPCIGCLACAEDNICKLKDDMETLRDKIARADALVIGAPNYFGGMNAITHAFLERFYQFRHREAMMVAGKIAVAVGVGGVLPGAAAKDMERFFESNRIELLGSVTAQGVAGCFTCGYGENCKVGAIHGIFGPGTKITDEITPDLCKQPEAVEKARTIGRQLSRRLQG